MSYTSNGVGPIAYEIEPVAIATGNNGCEEFYFFCTEPHAIELTKATSALLS